MSGGGARGAYQAGVLKGIEEILQVKQFPFEILSSVSAGAINAAFLAMHADQFSTAVNKLAGLWSALSCDQVFHVGNLALIRSVLRNMATMAVHYQTEKGAYLFDTSPLKQLLSKNLDFKMINQHVKNGLLDLEVTATCYDSSETISFINASRKVKCWQAPRVSACMHDIQCQHIMASSAFPLFFPAINIDGLHFGDGGLRLSMPLKAAIKLGARKILVIGTRAHPSRSKSGINAPNIGNISFAHLFGNVLNALFLDNLDRDIEVVGKINDSLALLSKRQLQRSKWQPIEVLCIRPSVDIAQLAVNMPKMLPSLLQYLLGSFGSKKQSGDFLSFLLFESAFCQKLIELGYQDALQQKTAVLKFFDK